MTSQTARPWLATVATLLACLTLAATSQAASFFPREYAGLLDGGAHLPCIRYFILRAEAVKCKSLNIKVKDVKAEVCQTVAGPMLAIYSPHAARNVFIARIMGPQVVMLPLSSCQVVEREEASEHPEGCDESDPPHTAVMYGLMSGMLPGDYTLDITMLYKGFSFGKGKMRIDNETLHAASQPVTVDEQTPQNLALASAFLPGYDDCTYCEDRVADWPICNTSYVEGSWLSKVEAGGRGSKGGEHPSLPHHLATAHDNNMMHWQPKGCNFKPLEELDLAACLEEGKKHVCFVGDSQLRHMLDGFVDQVKNPGRTPKQPVGSWTDKQVFSHKDVSYILNTFGSGWVTDKLNACTHVIFNFGQWPLSPKPASRWSASHFARTLHQTLLDIKAYTKKRPNTRFYWASINSHAIGPKHMTCTEALDYRMLPFVELFNEVASGLADMYGVPKINTGSLTSHLSDLSYDGSHYHWQGSVGRHITTYVANVVCVQK